MMRKAWLGIFLLTVAGMARAENLPDFTDLVEKQGAAVANISVTQTQKAGAMPQIPNLSEDDPMFEFFRRFMPQQPPGGGRDREAVGQGSGFIISQDGYMLTNAHVVAGADEIIVKLRDKREFKAKVIGSDKRTDVALIKIDASGLPAVTIGNPDRLKVGEWVVAIGSPFGFENSVTKGIVSAKGRDLPQESLVPFIQTDAAINPGNSGGPLFNLKGEVVAINSQIYSRSGGFQGLAFSIPIDTAMKVADQIRTTGKVTRGWLGVLIQPVNKDLAETFGLSKAEGALVASVEKNSPAEKAGLEASDIITRFDNKPVISSTDLPRIVTEVKPGSKVPVQVWRKNANKDLAITVGELPANLAAGPSSGGSKRAPAKPDIANKLGLSLSDLTPDQRKEFKITNGVFVEDSLNAAGRAGIQKGDVILSVNNVEVKSVEQFNSIVNKVTEGKTVALLALQGDSRRFIVVKPDK